MKLAFGDVSRIGVTGRLVKTQLEINLASKKKASVQRSSIIGRMACYFWLCLNLKVDSKGKGDKDPLER